MTRSADTKRKKKQSATAVARKTAGAHNALQTPIDADERALKDLETSRKLLIERQKSPRTSARDFVGITAELRKVDTAIAVMRASTQRHGGLGEDELRRRAHAVLDRLRRTKAARDSAIRPISTEEQNAKAV